jgi:hypothetical protein
MLALFPFVAWLAALTSVVMLILLASIGELGRLGGAIRVSWLLLALYCQFFGASAIVAAVGLCLQTMLAIYLIARWRFTA